MYDGSSVQGDMRLQQKQVFSNSNRGTYGSSDVSSLLHVMINPLQVSFHVSLSHMYFDPHQK